MTSPVAGNERNMHSLKEWDLSVRPHDEPNAALYWPEMAGGLFVYKDWMKRDGSCGVRIFESDNSRVFLIIFTEFKNNTGPSVTNAIEDIVNQICQRILSRVALESGQVEDDNCTFVFVERYEIHPDELDWVELKYESGKWHSPKWRRADQLETTFLLNLLK